MLNMKHIIQKTEMIQKVFRNKKKGGFFKKIKNEEEKS